MAEENDGVETSGSPATPPSIQEVRQGPIVPPRIEEEIVDMNPNLTGIPRSFREGAGAANILERTEDAQVQTQQIIRDQLNTSVANSVIETLSATPDVVGELLDEGTAELEPHREELTEDIPLYLHDDIMRSLTLDGARAKAERFREDDRAKRRLAKQTGISAQATRLAAGLLDADLPLIFASGGTVAAGRTALTAARVANGLTRSTALSRAAGDFAVGISGGALSGSIVGGAGMIFRDDMDVTNLFEAVMAGAATGGAVNPVAGRILPDRDVWERAAEKEVQEAVRRAERDIHGQTTDPDAPLHDNSSPVETADAASVDVPPAPEPRKFEGDDIPEGSPRDLGAKVDQEPEFDITEDTLGLSKNAPDSVVQTSIRNQKWRQNSSFRELFEEDTKNPFMKVLQGSADYEVRVPFSDRKVNIGQLAGLPFNIAKRDFNKLVNSRSPTANFIAAEILESSSGLVRDGSTSSVLREMFHSSSLIHSAKPLRDFRSKFYKARGLNPVNVDNQRRFSSEMRIQMQKRYLGEEVDDEFVDIIDSLDKTHFEVLNHLKGIDERRAVRGAREIEHRPGYFRYDWSPERFVTFLRRQNGEESLRQAFRDGYMRASGIDSETADKIAKAVIRRFRTRGVGRDAADSRLLDLDSRSGIEEVLEGADLPRKEIDKIINNITANAQERTKKGYLKQRVEVDLKTRIPGSEHRLADLMTDDFERSIHRYVGDASGAAALAHKGIRDKAEMNNMIDALMEEQFALGESALKREEVEAIMSQFSGGTHKGYVWGQQTEGSSPLVSTLGKATRASLLQRVGLTQLMDSANGFVGNGVARNMEPIMAKLGWNKPGSMSKPEMQSLLDELNSIGVVAGKDHDIFAPHMSIDETELASNVLINAAQRGMSSIERMTNFVSGQIAVTSFQQQVAASAVTTNVIKNIAGETNNLTNRMLRDIGLDRQVGDLRQLIDDGVIKVNGSKIELNPDQWPDELKLEFGSAVTRAMHQQVQKPLIGETSVWMNSDIGRLLSALKTFSLVATQKQMSRNLMIGGASHFVTASAWQMGFAYSVLTLAQGIQGQEMGPADRGWLSATYTPNIGTVPMMVDPMTSMMGFDSLNFSPYGRYASYLDTPVFETTESLAKSPGAIQKMLRGEGDYEDMKNAKAMFFLNWFGMKRLWENM